MLNCYINTINTLENINNTYLYQHQHMKTSGAFVLVTLLTLFNLLPTYTFSKSDPMGFRVDLTHIDAGKGYSRSELFTRAVQRSKNRAKNLSRDLKGPINVRSSEGEYLLELAIGTPPLRFEGILDTGSDLIWTQCTTCMQCIPQPTPYFDPFHSPTFSPLPCSHKLCRYLATNSLSSCAPNNCLYAYSYGGGTITLGFMGTETFTFGAKKQVSVPKLGFGCGMFNEGDIQNSSGLIGFGRGPLSLISQLGVTAFSYCFTETPNKSPLFFGSLAKLSTGPNVRTIPFVKVKPSSLYHIPIKGITVGNTLLPIPPEGFRVQKNGAGGMIIDSGTNFLMLSTPIYNAFSDAVKAQVKLPVNETDLLCYNSKPSISKLVFHFETADWEIPESGFVIQDDETKLYCFTVLENFGALSILGNIQTQNFHVRYDLENEELSFEPKQCDRL